jgi:hypothetical protein
MIRLVVEVYDAVLGGFSEVCAGTTVLDVSQRKTINQALVVAVVVQIGISPERGH